MSKLMDQRKAQARELSRAHRIELLALATAGVLLAGAGCGGCEDDDLRAVRPQISVCAAAAAPVAECNRPFELGDKPMGAVAALELYLLNRGDGALQVTAIESTAPAVTVAPTGAEVQPGAFAAIEVAITPDALGPTAAELVFESDDEDNSPLRVELRWNGLPEPTPKIELCTVLATGIVCGSDIAVEFGSVRRSQVESRTVEVRNAGTASLAISQVVTVGQSSMADEIRVGTSTRPGELAPGASADVIILYQPADGVPDAVELQFHSDDPANAIARVSISGSSVDNLPPIADARHVGTGATSAVVAVSDPVLIDGSGSSDPEGDPLRFSWTLIPPAQSAAALDDPGAALVRFVPDVAGSYRVELLVVDSLEMQSTLAAVVLIQARPRHALRAGITWQSGGDVDLHLVASGGDLFGSGDCYFENPRPDFGIAGDVGDDPELLGDAQRAPGSEEVVLVAPAAGRYRLYAHYYDDDGAGAAVVTARVVFNDASFPALQETRNLSESCALWYIGDVVFPDAQFNPSGAANEQRCP
ncbi:MAG: choice-of-anchor D domain-containing protein [Deltaproteobacteria bacterium]|nr:choice-of-anchor D domain-containing protein [Deltaproteobacteria bacterium]